MSKNPFSLQDLGLAYRKAKVDLYYSSHASLLSIADYEGNLADNLQTLLTQLTGEDETWVKTDAFLGGWTLAPKSIECSNTDTAKSALIFSSQAEAWKHSCETSSSNKSKKKPEAEFRLMAQCSLDFHVLSALWMLKVGQQYDKRLTDNAYGNRLRRNQKGEINPLSLGSFKPYLKPFRDWRDKGIEAMRSTLAADKKIVALTADVSSFYHELNPGFMLNDDFNQLFSLKLSKKEEKLHRLFINALQAWAQNTPLKKGLPVGLPASAVVANVALIELDQLIEQQIAPLYYGRYVDDILLIMENGADFQSTASLWQWLFDRADGKLGWVDKKQTKVSFQPVYLRDSQIYFANSKNKVFLLSGEPGKRLVESIANQIYQRASEWRALPNLPTDPGHIGTDLVAATQADGETADNLRKADALTMRRAGFAIKLRDFEAYERDLAPEVWQQHRHAFFHAFTEHVLVLPIFFELAGYLPRIIRLATVCEDFEHLYRILDELKKVCDTVEQYCTLTIKSCKKNSAPGEEDIMRRWRHQAFGTVYESIIAAFPCRISRQGKADWLMYMAAFRPFLSEADTNWLPSITELQKEQARLFSYDLAHMPFRFSGMPREMIAQRGIPAKKTIIGFDFAEKLLPESVIEGNKTLAKWVKFKGLPHGLLFATRPFNLTELFVLQNILLDVSNKDLLRSVVLALRGFSLTENMPQWNKRKNILEISHDKENPRPGVAVSSWETKRDSLVASVTKRQDPDLTRYVRLNRLVNGVISQPKGAGYFILPELALPAKWFLRLAYKLQGRGISLIAGMEYLHARGKRVRNQVWAALLHDGLGFPALMIYRQDKQHPAPAEERELQRLAGLKLMPETRWKSPPVLQHGDFRFALLVCSELTNIHYRAALRGEVDALFVPEWNQDTETFNALVESAALDIHAYIIQCNNREYGDSRIRAPYKDNWKRDLLRVKGGIYDYCVTGRIDIAALRKFQSSHRSPEKPFKPVPDGFENDMNYWRKVLPAGENNE